MLLQLHHYILLFTVTKSIKTMVSATIILGLTPKTQTLGVCIVVILAKNYNVGYLLILTQFRKIKIFLVKQKFNVGLFFNKVMLVHITSLVTLIIILGVLPGILSSYRSLIWIQSLLISFNILGVYWSTQENLWGGAWDWNFIEMGVTVVTLYLLVFLHKKTTTLYTENMIIVSTGIYLIYNHIPVILSVHNFTSNKFTKYTTLLLVLGVSTRIKGVGVYYTTGIFLLWFVQFTKLEVPNIWVKLWFSTTLLYYLVHVVKSHNNWFTNYLPILITVFTSFKGPKNNILLSSVHRNTQLLLLLIIFYQGSYNVQTGAYYLQNQLSNLKVTQVTVNSKFWWKKHQIQSVRNIGIMIKNNQVKSYGYIN